MKKIKSAIIFIIIQLCFLTVGAQEKVVIKGRVIDSRDKITIVGATIAEYDKDNRVVNGTITNINGDFVYQMNDASNTVKISVIGYKAKEIEISPDINLIVELESDDIALGEVQVVAELRSSTSLTNLDDRDRASSSVKIDLMEMQDGGMLSAADALQGKVSGLDIIADSGDPGSGSQLVIRGLSSMGNNRPLIVIDGIPKSKVSNNFDLSSADSEDIGNLLNLALQDIKSIEVLKDAASTAIYGSRGADGVLLIETHKGRMGKVQFDYQYRSNLSIQPPPIPMLDGDEYIMLQMEEWHNRDGGGTFILPSEISYDRDYFDFYNYSQNTDWIKEITQNGISQDHYFSISGGGDKTRYFTSFSYLDEEGTTINTGFSRFSTRINLDYFLSRNLLFQIQFNYISSLRERNAKLGGTEVREMAYRKAPNMSVWELDQYGNQTGEYFTPIQSYQGNGVQYFNPVAVANLSRRDDGTNELQNTFLLQYRFNDWLTFRETVSFQYSGVKQNEFIPYNAIGQDWLGSSINRAQEGNNESNSIRTETQLAFSSPFKNQDHEVSGAFTWQTNQEQSKWMNLQSTSNPSTDIQDPSINSKTHWIGNGGRETRLLSSVNSVNYKAFDRYMLQGTLTLDSHSSFGANNRWGMFYGISAGWRFSNEPFLESINNWLDESMLRISWGVTGIQPRDPYARFSTYESTPTGSYIINPAIESTRPQLENLQWATVESFDIGFELNLFKGSVYVEGDIYEKVTSNILFEKYDIPYSSGFNQFRYLNGGQLTNRGWELMADFRIIRNKDWSWSLNINSSQNINRFDALPENFNTERSTSISNGEYPRRVMLGEPIGSFFGFRYLGVWESDEDVIARNAEGKIIRNADGQPLPLRYTDTYTFKAGDPIYKDLNYDGVIDINDVEYIGDSNPKFIGGFGTNLKYKNLGFSAAFHYRLGFDIVNGVAINTQGMLDRNNQSKAVLNRWRVQGQNFEGMLPRAYMDHPASNLGSDRYVEKGDFLRLSNVKLTYQLNRNLCRKIGVRKLNFALSARKLLTLTGYSGQDPEVGQTGNDPFWIGVDKARTPPPKVITFSIGIGI
jgi:TonB-linked SusC/RagA family outer membrane protein